MNRRWFVVAAVLVVVGAVAALLVGGDRITHTLERAGAALRGDTSPDPSRSELVGAAGDAREAQTEPARPDTAAAEDEPRQAAPVDTTLALGDSQVLVSYPAGFDLAVTREQLASDAQPPACDEGFDYCIYLDPTEFAGTTFSSAGLGIRARVDLTTEADCILTQPDGYRDLVPTVSGASGFATTLYHGVDQGAAGHVSTGSVGRLYYDSVCYQFATRVAQSQVGNYPAGTIEAFDEAEQERTAERLLDVMGRVTLPDGRSSLWMRAASGAGAAADDRARSAAFPTVREPEAGAAVTSPLRLAGEAPGTWFFEASFPYLLVAADGEVVASGAVTTDEDWMTEGPVRFEASVEFTVPGPTDAVLHLHKDNPSGLPENDASVEVPLHLLP